MNVTIRVAKSFKTAVKPLLKRHASLKADLLALEKSLTEMPEQGTALGNNVYKIRLKIASTGKGKSGGARVISLVETVIVGTIEIQDKDVTVNLLTIYDKADTATITDKELKTLVAAFRAKK